MSVYNNKQLFSFSSCEFFILVACELIADSISAAGHIRCQLIYDCLAVTEIIPYSDELAIFRIFNLYCKNSNTECQDNHLYENTLGRAVLLYSITEYKNILRWKYSRAGIKGGLYACVDASQ